jgi:co-chaperonin GroES (HSP10)
MLKAKNEHLFIDVDFDENSKRKLGDIDIYIETNRDNTRRLMVMRGRVYSCPPKFAEEYNIKDGDLVYCHHFMLDKNNRVHADGKELCMIHQGQVFFRLNDDGSMDAFNEYVISEPVMEHESNYISASGLMLKANPDELKLIADAVAVAPKVKEVKVGDRFRYSPNSDYDIYIDGKKYYKMRGSNFDIDFVYLNKEDVYDSRHK